MVGHQPGLALAHRGEAVVVAGAHQVERERDQILRAPIDRHLIPSALRPRTGHLGLVIAGDEARLARGLDAVWRKESFEEGARGLAVHATPKRQRRGARRSDNRARGLAGSQQRREGGGVIVVGPAVDLAEACGREA